MKVLGYEYERLFLWVMNRKGLLYAESYQVPVHEDGHQHISHFRYEQTEVETKKSSQTPSTRN